MFFACVMFIAKFTSSNGLRYHKIRYKSRENNPIKPFQLCTGSLWYLLKFSDIYNYIGIMLGGGQGTQKSKRFFLTLDY